MHELSGVVGLYIEIKCKVTNYMQKNFRLTCVNCRFYHGCSLYESYVDAWMNLQSAHKKAINEANQGIKC